MKPRYHIYVVVIGESARRDAMGAFGGGHWDNYPFASHVNGDFLYMNYIAASGSAKIARFNAQSREVDNETTVSG